MSPRVLIVGSGPTGATYARRLLETARRRLRADGRGRAGRDPSDRHEREERPRPASSRPPPGWPPRAAPPRAVCPASRAASSSRARSPPGRAPTSSAVPPTAPRGCRPRPAPPASAGRGCTGPAPRPPPPAPSASRSSTTRSGSSSITAAEALLHVYRPSFDGAPQAQAILERIRDEFAPDGITVRPLPVAADPRERRLAAVERHGRRPRAAGRGRARRPVHAAVRDPVRPGASARATAPSAPCCATSGRAPRRRSVPTPSCWPPTRSAPRSCCGPRASAPRRSAGTSPSTRCCSAWWPCGPTSCPPREESSGPVDPIRAIVAIPFDEERHPYSAQMMFSPVSPAPLPEGSRFRDNPAGYVGMGWGIRKWPRPEDRLTFEDDRPDENGLPGIRIAYELTEREEADFERARKHQARAAAALGEFVDGMPKVMPAGQLAALHGHRPHGRDRRRHQRLRPVLAGVGRARPRARRQRPHPDRQLDEPDADQRRPRGPRRHGARRPTSQKEN